MRDQEMRKKGERNKESRGEEGFRSSQASDG